MNKEELRAVLEEFLEPRPPDDVRDLERTLLLALQERSFHPSDEQMLEAVEVTLQKEEKAIRGYLLALDASHRAKALHSAALEAVDRRSSDLVRAEEFLARQESAKAEEAVNKLWEEAEPKLKRIRQLREVLRILRPEG